MTLKKASRAAVFPLFCFASCINSTTEQTAVPATDTTVTINQQYTMKSYISLFEIPATEISRAIRFYEAILNLKIEKIEMPDMQMGVFPYEEQRVPGIILQAEGSNPSADGVCIYLDGGDNLQVILDKVEQNGGTILVPKTAHADGNGYFALFLDSEGNRMGLNSPN